MNLFVSHLIFKLESFESHLNVICKSFRKKIFQFVHSSHSNAANSTTDYCTIIQSWALEKGVFPSHGHLFFSVSLAIPCPSNSIL